MKNVHVLLTDKPSRFFNTNTGEFHFREHYAPDTIQTCKNHNIYITSDEEIKVGDCVLLTNSNILSKCGMIPLPFPWKKIILTTDQDLINDGVQPINDEFLEWFVKNPSCEKVGIENGWGLEIDIETPYYKIIIQKEENIYDEYLKDELKKYKNIKAIVFNKPEEPKQETLPTKWFKTEEIETWIGESITADKPIEEIQGGRGKLIILHQCGENKEELISQLETMIYGLKDGFEYFAQ